MGGSVAWECGSVGEREEGREGRENEEEMNW